MDSRKRFKSNISDEYVRKMFDKSHRKRKQNLKVATDDSPLSNSSTIMSIPSKLLVTNKLAQTSRKRSIAKPENWLPPKESITPSRSDVMKVEKDNITKKLKEQQGWRRAARSLNVAINKPKSALVHRPIIPDEDDDDNFSRRSDLPTTDQGYIVRKNHSKEFLDSFFKKASLIKAEMARKC